MIANVNRGKNSKVYSPMDFLPEDLKKRVKENETPSDPNEVIDMIRKVFKNKST